MRTVTTVTLGIMLCATNAWAGWVGDSVEVRVVTDDGQTLPTYAVHSNGSVQKAYAEAVKGDCYKIEVKNHLNKRVGLVIAVDGRNIVNGKKSWLKSGEAMYILEPYGTGEFSGWRTSISKVNRFYFTDVPDSYAAAFGDESAMGVIAVAAFPERYVPPPPPPPRIRYREYPSYPYEGEAKAGADGAGRTAAAPKAAAPASGRMGPAEESAKKSAKAERSLDSAGTGYGQEEYSLVHTVEFEPQKTPVERVVIKYEWHATLCKLGVLSCDSPPRRPPNRLWDNDGFAPPPPWKS